MADMVRDVDNIAVAFIWAADMLVQIMSREQQRAERTRLDRKSGAEEPDERSRLVTKGPDFMTIETQKSKDRHDDNKGSQIKWLEGIDDQAQLLSAYIYLAFRSATTVEKIQRTPNINCDGDKSC